MAGMKYHKLRYRPSHKINRPPGTPENPQPDDLRTWPSNASFETMPLPAVESASPYFLIFEVTKRLTSAALADTYGLRFTGLNGVHLAHLRTQSNRIFVGGIFTPGALIPITVYWGKAGQSQPGNGFPAPATMTNLFRLFMLFEGGIARDYAPSPAAFTTVGLPTFIAGLNGQAMQCGSGNYIQTTAAKVRGDARSARHAMALIYTPTGDAAARTICWANWTNDQRAFQLWGDSNYVELYADDDGVTPYQKWVNRTAFSSGWSWIGCSWLAGATTAIVQRDWSSTAVGMEFPTTPAQGTLFNSNSPYIIGGTPVAGSYHAGMVETVLELADALTVDQMVAFDLAWRTNEQFLGIDRTPNAFTPAALINQELGVEVAFPKVQITGISPATLISISGGIAPSFAISSSLTAGDDIRAKSSLPGTISSGNFVKVWDTTSSLNSTTVRTDLTVGTVTTPFVSTTKPTAGTGGGSGIPTGPATYTVSSLAAGQAVINNQLSPGEILEFTAGDYRGQGTLTISGKDWSAGAKAVIRASTFGYRGPHPSDGGLFVSGEGAFTAGSGGAEFSGFNFINSKNFVVEGLRLWLGQGYETAAYQFISYCSNAVFKNCRFAGFKPSGYPNSWLLGASPNTWISERVPKGVAIKEATGCIFEKCLFQYFLMSCYIIGGNSEYRECVWTDSGGDHVMMSFANSGQKMIKCIFGRIFSPSGDVHADNLQCTTKTTNNSANQLYELCLFGPLNSGDPHSQGPFFDQDGAAYVGPDNVIFKDSLIESRVVNAFYAAYAQNCQIQNVTMLQNQFSGIDSGNVDTLIHTPVLNINPTLGPSRGGNVVNRTAYVSINKAAGDTLTNSYQLLPAAYAAQLTSYPLYPGTFNPVMFLTANCAVDAAELIRMAPKITSAIHPNQADIGAHRLFTHYGALP